ncbi:thiamine pyrophosphokinase [Pararhizobium antarcticum]|uniref:Thiamine diphosphokinase n=1 Tax=Pararhizobium antarcticum TaxID=1798805 RepID=A0A657LX84_9HYPH|nr:thiamine diphosphokinase [Pararhizobium antarcticum]OJF89878.1 thiamine pyrophosphokinase [Rhizobium sp. 58]OJF99825.1 thiamine pyrophosphokinase [Pararhizobium antarcticum]
MTHPDFAILMGGALRATDRLRRHLHGMRIIAADGGMRHAKSLGVIPERWMGDFDSTPPELIAQWPDILREPYPPAKNETDGEIAVSAALEQGAKKLLLAGALGGERSDHAFMHLLHAARLAEDGIDVLLTSGDEEAYPLLPGSRDIDLPQGSLFSILGLDTLTGLTITNARYPLSDFHLPFGSSRTISNVAEGPVRFSLSSGRAIILARPYDLSGA